MDESEDDDDDENKGKYQVLRPRNVPRRELKGYIAVDAYLDHSDSFRTMQEDDELESPDKSKDKISQSKDDVLLMTPRSEHRKHDE